MIVKKLSSRIESATLLDDRRDSVRAIKGMFLAVINVAKMVSSPVEKVPARGDRNCDGKFDRIAQK